MRKGAYMGRKGLVRTGTASADRKIRSSINIVLGLMAMVIIVSAGCASGFRTIAPNPPEKYEKLGTATGEACGSMLLGPTAYNFIPIMLNERVEVAYQRALDSVPGSRALINVRMQENWYWWVLGTARCVTIKGEAIR
jgi:hypothetical protein